MRITILSERDGFHAADLRRAAEGRGHAVDVRRWTQLRATVACDEEAAPEVVLPRSMPVGSLEQVIFRMDVLQRWEACGARVVNSPRAVEISVDKYLASARLAAAGLPTPATVVCQRLRDATEGFERLGGDAVLKPMFGSEGFGITRLDNLALAQRAFALMERMGSVIYLQRTVAHDGGDLRLFVVGDEVIAAMRRVPAAGEFRANLAQGGHASAHRPTDEQCDLAIRAARACAAEIAGVDLIVDRQGRCFVLEVNAAPGWRGLSQATGVDVAQRIVRHLERSLHEETS